MDPRIKKLGEFGLIDQLVKRLPALPARRWPAGNGDDTSVLKLQENHYQLFTQDLLFEGVHFRLENSRNYFRDLGWKALAVNLSDIAAMGGVPQEAVVGLGLPGRISLKQLEEFYDGLAECSEKHHCPVAGGDTNRFTKGLVIAVAVTGYAPRLPKLRRGTRPGDSLWVTGSLGRGALGWAARRKGDRSKATLSYRQHHARPEPRLAWGQRLGELSEVHSMIDLSDGLVGDLKHLMTPGKVGFEIDLEAIPRDREFSSVCKRLGITETQALLASGEDYELLFTLDPALEPGFHDWLLKHGVKATLIGRARGGGSLVVRRQGRELKKLPRAYQHFSP